MTRQQRIEIQNSLLSIAVGVMVGFKYGAFYGWLTFVGCILFAPDAVWNRKGEV